MLLSLYARAADCPPGNVITKMTSTMQAFKDALPLDYSSLKMGGALLSKVEIIRMTETMVCGRFLLKTLAGDSIASEAAGEFNVKLERSRY
jgi:hypothetical protein